MTPNKDDILQRLYNLMSERGVNAKQVTTDLNMSASSFTDWKNGRASPKVEALCKLSGYFCVSLDYLITGKEFHATTDEPKDEPEESSGAIMEFSNPIDAEMLNKFRRLPADCQGKVLSYIDGMLAVLPLAAEQEDARLLG